MANIPKKINPTCSNSYLLDERLCIGDSLPYINFNVNRLSNNLNFLESVGQKWNQIFSVFSLNSSQWIQTVNNISTFSSDWIDVSNTVEALSGTWFKQFILHYPTMININTWYGYSQSDKENLINNWLDINLLIKDYNVGQKITMYITLQEQFSFSFSFNRNYFESCTPNGGGGLLSCTACGVPNRGCNWQGVCYNAYTKCSIVRVDGGPVQLSCTGRGGRTLTVATSRPSTDTHVARIVEVNLTRSANKWNIVSEK